MSFSGVRDAISEFWSLSVSKVGIAFLAFLIGISLYTLATMPLDFGIKYWNNPTYWADYPKAAAPSWVNLFLNDKLVEHKILSSDRPEVRVAPQGLVKCYNMTYNYEYSQFPSFLTVRIKGIRFYSDKSPVIKFYVSRPDGKSIELYTLVPQKPDNPTPPYILYADEPRRILLTGDLSVGKSLSSFLYEAFSILASPSDVGYEPIIFGVPSEHSFSPLKGVYTFSLALYPRDPSDSIDRVEVIVGGRVYGALGTDTLGRDLAQGILFGFPVALLIGVVTSLLTTMAGGSLGIVSGYMGGKIDEIIQRLSDTVANVPQLPLLIFLVFVFGGKLWLIVFFLVIFGWPGLTIIVRSMVLQVRDAQFVEAAVALGASRARIMFRHILPQVFPFILAQMIFYTPSAILSEAALSFLGLGDPSIPTWGQILEYGFKNGAVYLGYWWWVLPPGLLLIISAVTFVFIALGLEPVVNPRLRRWR